jgi:hypothetical protein
MALSGCVPFVGSAPLHDPDAVQGPALLLFQVKVALPPETTEGTFVVKVSAGAGGVDEPPPPPPPPPLAHALPLKTAAGEAADKNYLTNATSISRSPTLPTCPFKNTTKAREPDRLYFKTQMSRSASRCS